MSTLAKKSTEALTVEGRERSVLDDPPRVALKALRCADSPPNGRTILAVIRPCTVDAVDWARVTAS
jgi:hypothetical protein